MTRSSHGAEVALAEPDEALLGYLQTLLDEMSVEPEPAPPAVEQRSALGRPVALSLPEAPELAVKVAEPLPTVAQSVSADSLPDWASSPFPLLHFEASGSHLSMLLVCMRRIVRLDGRLTPLPGGPSWYLGLVQVRAEKVGVIDLGQLLAPGTIDRPPIRSGYVLVLDDARCGLVCDSLGNAEKVAPAAVRWRRQTTAAPPDPGHPQG